MSLGKFLNEIYTKKCDIKHKYSSQIVSDVESSVKELLWRIIHKGHKLKVKDIFKNSDLVKTESTFQDLFPISEFIPVGSYYENTKVGDPFEFDFMLLIDIDDLQIEQGCGPGLVKVKRQQSSDWLDFSKDGFLQVGDMDSEYLSLKKTFHGFIEKLTATESEYLSESQKMIENPSGRLKCLQSGALHFAFLWSRQDDEDHVISVDTMPAFKCPDDFIQDSARKNSFDEEFLDLVREQRCYFIPKPCINSECTSCFHVTYATSENALMRQIDKIHKMCYIVLKYLVALKSDYEDNLTDISSYKLKTCLLDHVYGSKERCCSPDLENCSLDICRRLIVCYDTMNMPKFFQKDSSLFLKADYEISVLDIFVANGDMLRELIHKNQTERETISEAMNVLAWFYMTRNVLILTWELLLNMRNQPLDTFDFYQLYEPFEDISHCLDYHLATCEAAHVKHTPWINKLSEMHLEFHLPIMTLMSKNIPDAITEKMKLEGRPLRKLRIPVYESDIFEGGNFLDKLRSDAETSKERHKYIVYLASGWFSVYNGQDFISRKCCGDEIECVGLVHHTFLNKLE